MPTFDIVSEVDSHQLTNAVDQCNRTITTRFDFKGVDAGFERSGSVVLLHAEAEIQLNQMVDMLRAALVKCKIDPRCMEESEQTQSGMLVKQQITIREGIDPLLAKRMVKMVKEKKMKVQAQVQGDQVRVTGKKRDDLQAVMAMFRESDIDLPLQFNNFRD